jgi:hypothetical protein
MRYWSAFALCLFASIAALQFGASPFRGEAGPIVAYRNAAQHVGAALLVAAIWAILFRSQLQQGRVSLVSMLVLVTMQVLWFGAKQFFGDWLGY